MPVGIASPSTNVLSGCPVCGSTALTPFYEDILECCACHYARRSTPHTAEEIQRWYGEAFWNGTTMYTSYEDDWFAHRRNFERLLKHLRGFRASGRLLEIGCASGHFLRVAQSAFEVQGVELSEVAARRARQAGFSVLQGDFLDHADRFASASFDVVCLWDTFEHVDRPLDYLTEIHRLLKPDGVLMVTTPDRESFLASIQGTAWRHYAPGHLHYFGRTNVRRTLETRGYRVLAVEHLPVHRSLTQMVIGMFFFGRRETAFSKRLKHLLTKFPPISIGINLRDIMTVSAQKP